MEEKHEETGHTHGRLEHGLGRLSGRDVIYSGAMLRVEGIDAKGNGLITRTRTDGVVAKTGDRLWFFRDAIATWVVASAGKS